MTTLLVFWLISTSVQTLAYENSVVNDCIMYGTITKQTTKYVERTCYVERETGKWSAR